MEHLDTATLEDFKAFNKNSISNAVLVVAGDLKSCYQRWIEKILWPNQKAKLKTKFH
jgi:hypothetical protein